MTEIPYEIILDDVQWNMLQEALSDGNCVTFVKNGKRIQMFGGGNEVCNSCGEILCRYGRPDAFEYCPKPKVVEKND